MTFLKVVEHLLGVESLEGNAVDLVEERVCERGGQPVRGWREGRERTAVEAAATLEKLEDLLSGDGSLELLAVEELYVRIVISERLGRGKGSDVPSSSSGKVLPVRMKASAHLRLRPPKEAAKKR